jgi:hypothetical protein
MPHSSRLAAALSLVVAMALTGSNVAFGKAIAAAVPVYLFVVLRFAVASAALAPTARGELGPRLSGMSWTKWAGQSSAGRRFTGKAGVAGIYLAACADARGSLDTGDKPRYDT